jgi:RHS repeat-associated protein
VYAGGKHLATYADGTTYFDHGDHVGTERARTTATGGGAETCQSLPFGDGQSCSGSDISPMHFMGKERDPESNIDDFGARFYSSTFGRWMSPDWSATPEPVPYANLSNPQTLNLYALVQDNPETFADLDGHDPDPQSAGNLGGTNGLGPCEHHEAAEARYPIQLRHGTNRRQPKRKRRRRSSRNQQISRSQILFNETGSLRPGPDAKPGAPGSAEDLANGRQAVAEIANRVIDAGHPNRVAPDSLTAKGAAAVATDPLAKDAYGRSRTAADAALGGSNISNGAMQFRTRVGDNISTPLGRSSTNPGTTISQHYGPFVEGGHIVVIVVAP